MITKVIVALLLFSGGTMIEHTVTGGVKDCLEKKRIIQRNMQSDTARVECVRVEAQIETIEGVEFIRSMSRVK
jgi:cell division protein FtsX